MWGIRGLALVLAAVFFIGSLVLGDRPAWLVLLIPPGAWLGRAESPQDATTTADATTTPRAPDAFSPTEPSPTGGEMATTLDAELRFRRTGGIGGFDEQVVVKPDGSATVTDGDGTRSVSLSADQLDELRTSVAASDWTALQKAATSPATADDDYQFHVAYAGQKVEIAGVQLPQPIPKVFDVAQDLLPPYD